MDTFWKYAAIILLTVILSLSIGKTEKDIAMILTMFVCAAAAAGACTCLLPVLDFLKQMESAASLQTGLLKPVFHAAGIGMAADICTGICRDAGKESLGRAMQLLSSAAIFSAAVPVFHTLLDLIHSLVDTL